MYKILLKSARGTAPLAIQIIADTKEHAIKRAQKLLSDELCTAYTIGCAGDEIKIYDDKGLCYKSAIIEVVKNEKTNRRKKVQHSRGAKDRLRR